MPLKPKTLCRYPGCGRAVRSRYCEMHAPKAARLLAIRRGSAHKRGYDAAWERVAASRRALDGHLCQSCVKYNRVVMSSTVDHIVPIYVRPDWRLDIDNTQVLCNSCHAKKTNDDLRRYGSRDGRLMTALQTQNRVRARELPQPPRYEEA